MKSAEVVKKTTTKFHKSLITMASFTICNDEDITLNPNPRVGKLTLMTEDDSTSKIGDDNIEDFIDDLDNESPITSLPVGDWRNKVLSAETKDFFANQWIKVPLRTNFRPELDHLNYNHQLSDKSGKEEPRRSIHRKVLPLIGFLLCSIGITGAFVVFFMLVVNGDEAMTSSGVATLQISLNSSLTAQLKDWRTAERQQFDKDFCSSMITIFKSTKGPVKDRSPVCRVKSLRAGSIVVVFTITMMGDLTGVTEETFEVTIAQVLGNTTSAVQREGLYFIPSTFSVLSIYQYGLNNKVLVAATQATNARSTVTKDAMSTTLSLSSTTNIIPPKSPKTTTTRSTTPNRNTAPPTSSTLTAIKENTPKRNTIPPTSSTTTAMRQTTPKRNITSPTSSIATTQPTTPK